MNLSWCPTQVLVLGEQDPLETDRFVQNLRHTHQPNTTVKDLPDGRTALDIVFTIHGTAMDPSTLPPPRAGLTCIWTATRYPQRETATYVAIDGAWQDPHVTPVALDPQLIPAGKLATTLADLERTPERYGTLLIPTAGTFPPVTSTPLLDIADLPGGTLAATVTPIQPWTLLAHGDDRLWDPYALETLQHEQSRFDAWPQVHQHALTLPSAEQRALLTVLVAALTTPLDGAASPDIAPYQAAADALADLDADRQHQVLTTLPAADLDDIAPLALLHAALAATT